MTTETQIDLMPFCGADVTKWSLSEPFVYGGRRIATDGAICIAVHCEDQATIGKNVPGRHCLSYLDRVPAEAEWHPWPITERTHCEHCGHRLVAADYLTLVAGVNVQKRYSKIIGTLPSVEWCRFDDGDLDGVFFRFQGGLGFVMNYEVDTSN